MRTGAFACLFGAVLTVTLSATPLSGQAQPRTWTVSLGAGPSVPLGDLADEARTGFHAQGSVGYAPADLPIGFRADLFYQDLRNVERDPGLYVSLGGEWFRQLSLMANATYAVPVGGLAPYGLLGAGLVREWHGDRAWFGTRQATLSVHSGVGVEFPLLGSIGFVEARFLNLFGGEPLPLNPPAIHQQVKFQSIPVTFGLRF